MKHSDFIFFFGGGIIICHSLLSTSPPADVYYSIENLTWICVTRENLPGELGDTEVGMVLGVSQGTRVYWSKLAETWTLLMVEEVWYQHLWVFTLISKPTQLVRARQAFWQPATVAPVSTSITPPLDSWLGVRVNESTQSKTSQITSYSSRCLLFTLMMNLLKWGIDDFESIDKKTNTFLTACVCALWDLYCTWVCII